MAFVPEANLHNVWDTYVAEVVGEILDDETLDQDLGDRIHGWLDYVSRSYIGEVNAFTMKRKKPIVAISVWSKFDHIMAGEEDLTNNCAENFNSVSKVRFFFKVPI